MAAPFIMALDISKSCTGIAEGRVGEKPRAYSIKGKDDDVIGAVCKLGKWLIERTAVDRPDWIYFEAPISINAFRGDWDPQEGRVKMTSNPHTTMALAKMTGIVEFVANMRSIPAREARVNSVRKDFVGHGNLKGDEAKRRVRRMCELLGWSAANYDEADSMAVWHFGCLKVAPHSAAIITPMMQSKVASSIGGVDIGDGAALLKMAGTR